MKFEVVEDFKIKTTSKGIIELSRGQVIEISPAQAQKLAGKVRPLPYLDNEALNERMAIMGENCSPEKTEPFVTDFGVLVIPFNSNKKYHYWNGGQRVCDTLKELGRCDLIPKYKSPYSDN